jgi:hypothetical protein
LRSALLHLIQADGLPDPEDGLAVRRVLSTTGTVHYVVVASNGLGTEVGAAITAATHWTKGFESGVWVLGEGQAHLVMDYAAAH